MGACFDRRRTRRGRKSMAAPGAVSNNTFKKARMSRTIGQYLVENSIVDGIDTVFGIPGVRRAAPEMRR
jgi:hypothetical protein